MTEPSSPASPQSQPDPGDGHDHKPWVPAEQSPRELTFRAVAIGSVLGVIFAASSVYLGLKVGLTVSASIPVAVLSITLFRWAAKAFRLQPANILENNIVQTTGSAGESIAAGVAFTLPSLLLMGFELELSRILLVALLGGLIGVLMMIPLRHGLIVKEHKTLTYPEGTACADVLIVGEQGGTNAKTVFIGFFVGGIYAALNLILKLWKDTSEFTLDFWGKLKGGTMAFEVSPPMLGVGYIIGPKVSANMMAGGMLSFLVLVPLIHIFGDGLTDVMYPASKRIAEMDHYDIRDAYILYIGAGCVATGGFIGLARAVPTIISAFRGGLASLKVGSGAQMKRTERDLPMTVVVGGSLALVIAIWVAPILEINLVSAVLILMFGFFFVTVSSRITGEIGSSSNPISGMTVATLLITCGLFVAIGWVGVGYKAMALSTAALVCVAASNGGTISQDLKTGFLVGSTPRAQQIAILIGVISSGIAIGFVLQLLNGAHTTMKAVEYLGYKATSVQNVSDYTDEKENGPDGKSYRVLYIKDDVVIGGDLVLGNVTDKITIPRGKYLVDESAHIMFLVDPGVCGTYPYRVEAFPSGSAASSGATLAIPDKAPMELGTDRAPYHVVDVKEAQGAVAIGRYLVRDDGTIAYRTVETAKFDAPKAQLFRLIIDGTLGGKLPWGLVLIGVLLAIIMELVGVSALPFAVGLYLPVSTSAAIFVGGAVRWLVDRKRKGESAAEAEFSPGMLMASGLIAGGAITGVIQAVTESSETARKALDLSDKFPLATIESWWPMIPFLGMALALYVVGVRSQK
ncbi:MAG TPA: oligopeptide transporter, OPT family [Myxococcota bacterium]|jgi:putative OPT family oligopeptide transporter